MKFFYIQLYPSKLPQKCILPMNKSLQSLLSSKPNLTQGSSFAGSVFHMTVDEAHNHQHSSNQSSVSTIQTYIQEITLENKLKCKNKKITKASFQSKPAAKWNKAQVLELVELLKIYGSDFGFISTKMNKTRQQIKRKFKVFEKKYPVFANAIFQKTSQNLQAMIQKMDSDDFLNE